MIYRKSSLIHPTTPTEKMRSRYFRMRQLKNQYDYYNQHILEAMQTALDPSLHPHHQSKSSSYPKI